MNIKNYPIKYIVFFLLILFLVFSFINYKIKHTETINFTNTTLSFFTENELFNRIERKKDNQALIILAENYSNPIDKNNLEKLSHSIIDNNINTPEAISTILFYGESFDFTNEQKKYLSEQFNHKQPNLILEYYCNYDKNTKNYFFINSIYFSQNKPNCIEGIGTYLFPKKAPD